MLLSRDAQRTITGGRRFDLSYRLQLHDHYGADPEPGEWGSLKDVVTPYTHISEASRYILYTIILTLDGICTLS